MLQIASKPDARGLPDDVAAFRGRMAELGIDVQVANAGPNHPLPPLVQVRGVPLSETIIQARGGEE